MLLLAACDRLECEEEAAGGATGDCHLAGSPNVADPFTKMFPTEIFRGLIFWESLDLTDVTP